jgi:hypothetical protein
MSRRDFVVNFCSAYHILARDMAGKAQFLREELPGHAKPEPNGLYSKKIPTFDEVITTRMTWVGKARNFLVIANAPCVGRVVPPDH